MNVPNDKLPDMTPFAFPDLEEKNIDYLTAVKKEADRVISQTREKINDLKGAAKRELDARKEELDRIEHQLALESEKLVQRKNDLDVYRNELEQKSFDEARSSGFEQGAVEGKERGYAEGLASAQREQEELLKQKYQEYLQQKIDETAPILDNLIGELLNARQSLLKYWEKNILQIAAAIAYQTIMRKFPDTVNISLDLVKEALELAAGADSLKIRLNPNDIQTLRGPIEKIAGEMGRLSKIVIEADLRVSSAGCIVETPDGTIDQRLESRLERIIAELT